MRPILLPDRVLRCRSYEELRVYALAFARGELCHFAVLGPPGVGKSECVRRAMAAVLREDNWSTLRGHATPLALFEYLYENRGRTIVIDDVDELLSEPAATAMLKTALDTGSARQISWRARRFAGSSSDLPRTFEFHGRCSIIANASRIRSVDIEAIYDRCVCVNFDPTSSEVHREVARGGWFTDSQVFEHIGQHLHLIRRPSIRFYLQVRELRRANLEWRSMAIRMLEEQNSPELIVVQNFVNGASFDLCEQPEEERAAAFRRLTGKSRATYFRLKQELESRQNAEEIANAARLRLTSSWQEQDTILGYGFRRTRFRRVLEFGNNTSPQLSSAAPR